MRAPTITPASAVRDYVVLLFPAPSGLALAAIWCIELEPAGDGRRMGLWVFGICAVNAICSALIAAVLQVPKEVGHFAYVSSIAGRGRSPDRSPGPHMRWSSAEASAVQGTASSSTRARTRGHRGCGRRWVVRGRGTSRGRPYSLFPAAALAVLIALVRHRRATDARRWLFLAAAATQAAWTRLAGVPHELLHDARRGPEGGGGGSPATPLSS